MNICRRPRSTRAVAGILALGLASLTACSSTGTADGRKDGTLNVVASFYPMEYLAERIGGDHVTVTGLTKPGVEPHDLEINPRQTAALAEADAVVYLKNLQPAVDEAVIQSGTTSAVDAGSFTEQDTHGGEGDGHGHGAEEHGEGVADPHIWLDPVKYAEAARGVGKALEKADPDHASGYRKNTDALVGDLRALDDEFESGLRNRRTDTFVTTHSAFGHLAERYGLKQEAVSGLDPEAEPSPARIRSLHAIVKKERISTVFFETLVSSRTARTLAGDTGMRTDVLDPLEGITDKSRGGDYLEVMRANLKALQKALGAA
ncbi:metal ABC transporter substrate-binding protein [Streptomyces meridianus]|uniref:Metal ABC transporter substrate-binding protein n=1 Tax=Streptomyces meridianus TaxID=2938945 RepID=A0ABT0XB15_9ACTN|nr:metal ABC transporter substrate-binding protein [Streptomyces meridianus]MCM2578927.1 metal ABC transporter substrate-binding protein [Streptomyces meridianus]